LFVVETSFLFQRTRTTRSKSQCFTRYVAVFYMESQNCLAADILMLIIDCFSSQLDHYLLSVNVILGLINTLGELTLGSL